MYIHLKTILLNIHWSHMASHQNTLITNKYLHFQILQTETSAMEVPVKPFALKTLSYWSFLKSYRTHSCTSLVPYLIQNNVHNDILYLQQLQGAYQILPTASENALSTHFENFKIRHINDVKFECTTLRNLIHQKSIDTCDKFKLGINTFSSQVSEGDIEQSTMYNKEIFHCDFSCLVVMTEDYLYDWSSDDLEDSKIIEQVFMTMEQQGKNKLNVNFKKTTNWYREETAVEQAQAYYIKVA